MALYKENGTNPFASCLPILLQSPDLLRAVPGAQRCIPRAERRSARSPRSSSRRPSPRRSSGRRCRRRSCTPRHCNVKIVTVDPHHPDVGDDVHHAAPADDARTCRPSALDNPFAQQQKMLLYVLPLIFAISGINFPIGVLIYWLTTNLWSMGQQFYVIRRMPAPGSRGREGAARAAGARRRPGARARAGRRRQRRAGCSRAPGRGQRQQPKRQNRPSEVAVRAPRPRPPRSGPARAAEAG